MYTISDLSGKTCEERVLYCTISYKNISPSSRNTSLAVAESIYNNRIVTVCDHGVTTGVAYLDGRTVGRGRRRQQAGRNRRLGRRRGVAYEARGYKQGWAEDEWAEGQADGPNRANAQFWLVFIIIAKFNSAAAQERILSYSQKPSRIGAMPTHITSSPANHRSMEKVFQ